MAHLNPYLNFDGNCREAMNFYKECLGGNLSLQTVGESPLAAQMTPQSKDSILHSMLESKSLTIMGSDMVGGTFSNGNGYHLSLNCTSDDEINSLFTALARDGKVTEPIRIVPWGKFGSLVDKFGKSWLFNYSKN
jgi:PhnB protein